ncbi:hypothetical protein Lesp02_02530 [Lentzea sp. NBRC 105346]|nr:hypothetical protein Lesp02_02530 [Lentzea sp. NBRC 105346]
MIAALIPTTAEPRPPAAPMPTLPALRLPTLTDPGTLLIGTARIDRTGRVHERAVLRALGWEPGRRLELDTIHGLIVITPDPAGRHSVDHRGAITLPAAARRMCGVELGPPLTLAAAVRQQVLVVHPAATVAALLAAHYRDLIDPDDR